MSKGVSVAQALPSNLLHLIIRWSVAYYTASRGCAEHLDATVKELMSVCTSWRQAALEHAWNKLSLNIDSNKNRVCMDCPTWTKDSRLQYGAENAVRRLRISVSLSGVVNGVAHALLSEYAGSRKAFPIVHKLTLAITKNSTRSTFAMDTATHNAVEFTRLLKSLCFAMETAEVLCTGGSWYVDKLVENVFGVLANSLCTSTKYSSLNLGVVNFKCTSTIDNFPLVTTLSLRCENLSDLRASLVHKCASSLVSLSIELGNAMVLFYDCKGNAVVYPNMQHLQILQCDLSGSLKRVSVPDVMPFHKLKSLKLLVHFPFSDDVLFRGYSDSLECLTMLLDGDTATMLSKCHEFENKFRYLREVDIRGDFIKGDLSLASKATRCKFMSKLAGATCSLKLSTAMLFDSFRDAVLQGGHGFNSIKVLDCYTLKIALSGVMDLLKALPTLLKLSCIIGAWSNTFRQYNHDYRPREIIYKYGILKSQLRIFYTNLGKGSSRDWKAEDLALLALVCPNLYLIGSLHAIDPEFYERMEELIHSEMYSKYASRLRQLFLGNTHC